MTRTIHPVGQGAFYSETFSYDDSARFTAVYDCGGKVDTLSQEIDKLARVDVVFISHFHCDHINRLKVLNDKYKPKDVVFPHISTCHFLVDFVFNCIKMEGGCGTFMLRFLPVLRLANSGNGDSLIIDGTRYTPVKRIHRYLFPYESTLWEYISFNRENDFKEQKLCKKLLPLFGMSADSLDKYNDEPFYEEIAKRLREDEHLLEKVKNIYSYSFPGGHNSYSMPVLSHQIDKDKIEDKKFDCLYTGDVNVDNWVLDIASTYKPDYIQVPHHGSNYNHNPYLYKSNNIVFVSVGITNRYRHPGLITLPYIINTCKEVHVVTEDATTGFSRSIQF